MAFGKPEGRIYPTPVGKLWSVTTKLGVIDKSGALVQWAVNVTAEFLQREIRKACSGGTPDGPFRIDPSYLDRLIERAKKESRFVKQEAADIGSDVHALAEGYCRSLMSGAEYVVPQGLDERAYNAFGLWKKWAELVELEPLEMETKVHSAKHEFGGRCDLIARGFFNRCTPGASAWKKKRTYLVDTKTSKGFYDTFGPQVSAYAEGYRESCPDGHKIDGMGIIRVGREDGTPEFRDYSEHHTHNYETFLLAGALYIKLNGRPK